MVDNDIERQVAKRILSRVSSVTNQEFPVQESDYITLHLLAKSQFPQNNQTEFSKEALRDSVVQSFKTLGLDDIYHFSSDFQLIGEPYNSFDDLTGTFSQSY